MSKKQGRDVVEFFHLFFLSEISYAPTFKTVLVFRFRKKSESHPPAQFILLGRTGNTRLIKT
jgi:hypothetical protein